MKTSSNGLSFIAHEEGEVLHVYKDSVGIPTIGVGHRLLPGESYPNGITHDQAMQILARDVGHVEDAINSHVTVALNQNQFDALVSFTFNLGAGALESSTLLKLLNKGDAKDAAAEFPKWDHAGGKVDQEILGRRLREQALFMKPVEAPVLVKAAEPPPVPVVPVAAETPIPQSPVASVPVTTQPASPSTSPVWGLIQMIINLFTKQK